MICLKAEKVKNFQNYCLKIYGNYEDIINTYDKLGSKFPVEIEIKKVRKKRSVDANSYMWVLVNKIAIKLMSTKEEIYQDFIRRVGVFDDILVVEKAKTRFVETWKANGIGFLVEELDSKIKGTCKLRVYKGSSRYDSKEMARLIDEVVIDAKELGIETMTPNELKKLKESWKYNG